MRLMLVLLLCAASLAAADIRYHYGDDSHWADPKLDDSGWSVAWKGQGQRPSPQSSGFVWERSRVRVPAAVSGPLAIRIGLPLDRPGPPLQIYVNGQLVGQEGRLPPDPYQPVAPLTTVFDLAVGVTHQERPFVVALRLWYPPTARYPAGPLIVVPVEIGPARLERMEEASAIDKLRLAGLSEAALRVAFFLGGAAMLLLSRAAPGSRELLWFSVWTLLAGFRGFSFVALPDLLRLDLPVGSFEVFNYSVQAVADAALLEFQWAALNLTRRWPLRTLQIVYAGAMALRALTYAGSAPWVVTIASFWHIPFLAVHAATIPIWIWGFRHVRGIRGVAVAVILRQATVLLTGGVMPVSVIPQVYYWADLRVRTLNVTNTVFICAVFYMLLRRLWAHWRKTRELEAEFEAAREMQHSLVPPATAGPGFSVASAYLPAKHVGGDFFWTVPAPDGSLLLVAGDVSGKGLKAAMTVATLAGALRNEASRQPGRVLQRLNSVLIGHGGAGFTTCCAALFESDGRVTIANAGHIPPYRNGEEMPVESGLPLGLIAEPDYPESVTVLGPGDRIAFVSDGVVEARGTDGELYGFDRTRALSSQPAADIAETARAFGQEDDITAITIQRRAEATVCA